MNRCNFCPPPLYDEFGKVRPDSMMQRPAAVKSGKAFACEYHVTKLWTFAAMNMAGGQHKSVAAIIVSNAGE